MSLRNTLRKAAGLLVELPPEEETPDAHSGAGKSTDQMWAEMEKAAQQSPQSVGQSAGQQAPPNAGIPFAAPTSTKTVEQIVRDDHGPNLDQIKVSSEFLPTLAEGGETLNFSGIYQSAGLPTVPFSAEQVLDMMAALPANVPLDAKRQMFRVSLSAMGKAIGASPETIVADASRKLAALNAYTEHLAENTSQYTSLSEQKIASLQAEIEKMRESMAEAQQRQWRETQQCTNEAHRLDEVLEFFSLDVPPSIHSAENQA